MELEALLNQLSDKANKHREFLATEEAAKTALVLPFLQALGYDIFNPSEVIPEFICDVGVKKGEKVDYAICIDGAVRILMECKPASQELSIKHASQLYRYFSVTDAKFAILTNGANYKIFTDLDSSNRMDDRPFFEFDICRLRKTDIRTIGKFHRASFDEQSIIETAAGLQMEGAVVKALRQEMTDPSDDFVRAIADKVIEGRLSAGSKAAIKRHIPNAFNSIVRDQLNDRLTSALDDGAEAAEPASGSEIETTADEFEGFQIVRAIATELVDPSRVILRDAKSYCAILLDDNNRKPIARLHFNSETTRHLGTFDQKEETRHPISKTADIFRHKDAILKQIKQLA